MYSPLGVHAMLWIGKAIPTPPPKAVVDAFVRAEIQTGMDGENGFQITFALGRSNPVDYVLLQSGLIDVSNRVVIGVANGIIPSILIDGIITHHQIQTGARPGEMTLTVSGRDATFAMDLDERREEYQYQPDFTIVGSILARYPEFAFLPDLRPTTSFPIPLQRIPRQSETDLQFIRRMAQRNGYVFHVEPVSFCVNRAYFGPEVRVALPSPALSWGTGPSSNVDSLSFSLDGMAPVATKNSVIEPITKATIPLPTMPSLRVPPLALRAASSLRTIQSSDNAKLQVGDAIGAAVAAVSNTPDAVTANGEVDASRYGGILRPRGLVGLRGVGLSYDGFYYVRRVTHRLERGSYRQGFTISREGTISSVPIV
jgi:hypothetical protein